MLKKRAPEIEQWSWLAAALQFAAKVVPIQKTAGAGDCCLAFRERIYQSTRRENLLEKLRLALGAVERRIHGCILRSGHIDALLVSGGRTRLRSRELDIEERWISNPSPGSGHADVNGAITS